MKQTEKKNINCIIIKIIKILEAKARKGYGAVTDPCCLHDRSMENETIPETMVMEVMRVGEIPRVAATVAWRSIAKAVAFTEASEPGKASVTIKGHGKYGSALGTMHTDGCG